jgi:hypothetical protein
VIGWIEIAGNEGGVVMALKPREEIGMTTSSIPAVLR